MPVGQSSNYVNGFINLFAVSKCEATSVNATNKYLQSQAGFSQMDCFSIVVVPKCWGPIGQKFSFFDFQFTIV